MKELGEFFQANARKNLFTISELLRILILNSYRRERNELAAIEVYQRFYEISSW
jgi:hypothetical protein